MKKELIPAIVFPPGELLKDELESRNWTQKYLAEKMGRPLQVINEIINCKKSITAQTSIELAQVFNCSKQFWLNLEMQYQLFLAMKKQRKNNTKSPKPTAQV